MYNQELLCGYELVSFLKIVGRMQLQEEKNRKMKNSNKNKYTDQKKILKTRGSGAHTTFVHRGHQNLQQSPGSFLKCCRTASCWHSDGGFVSTYRENVDIESSSVYLSFTEIKAKRK